MVIMPVAGELENVNLEPGQDQVPQQQEQIQVLPQELNQQPHDLGEHQQLLIQVPEQQPPPVAEQENIVQQQILEENTQQLPELRSKLTCLPSFLSFLNCTERRVDVYWINYHGRCVRYKTIQPAQRLSLNTFVTHPWIFRDHITQAKLVVHNCEVFMPQYFRQELDPDQSGDVRPFRISYDITIPIYTLKERAIQVVLDHLVNSSHVPHLPLPASTKRELTIAACIRDKGIIAP